MASPLSLLLPDDLRSTVGYCMNFEWTEHHGYWAYSVYGVERGSVSRIFRKVEGPGYIAEFDAMVRGRFDSLNDAKAAVEKAHTDGALKPTEANVCM